MDSIINNNIIKIFPTPVELFQDVAQDFAERVIAGVAIKGEFTVVLSGGTTAQLFFYALVANDSFKHSIPWPRIKFFFADERYVPADDPQSNYYLAKKHLFDKVKVSQQNIYRMLPEFTNPKIAAQNYESMLRKVFKLKNNEFPKFDLVYLGLGANAHTASLMPFSPIPNENDQLVYSLWVPQLQMYRITLTPQAINQGDAIIFQAVGADKALAVWQTLQGPRNPTQYPAQFIEGSVGKKIIWYLDQASAAKL